MVAAESRINETQQKISEETQRLADVSGGGYLRQQEQSEQAQLEVDKAERNTRNFNKRQAVSIENWKRQVKGLSQWMDHLKKGRPMFNKLRGFCKTYQEKVELGIRAIMIGCRCSLALFNKRDLSHHLLSVQ